MDEKEIKEFVLNQLSNFNFRRYSKGFRYLNDAIFLCIKNSNAIDNLYKNVFPVIANQYGEKSLLVVKYSMEQSIRTMYNNTELYKICEYFNLEENIKPSLKLIIYTIVRNYQWSHNK